MSASAILYTLFLFLLIYGGLGVGVSGLGSWIGLFGLGFSADEVWACGVGPAGVLTGLELSILICKNNPGKKLCVLHMHQYIHV